MHYPQLSRSVSWVQCFDTEAEHPVQATTRMMWCGFTPLRSVPCRASACCTCTPHVPNSKVIIITSLPAVHSAGPTHTGL